MSQQSTPFSICPRCGTQAGYDDRFCRNCGFARLADPASSAGVPRPSGRGRGFLFLSLAVAAGIVIAGAVFFVLQSGSLVPKHTIQGTFVLRDTSGSTFPSIETVGTGCQGKGGYSDIGPGMPVTVKDESGKLLGATSLGEGGGSSTSCTFTFTITGVGDAQIYSVEGGRRGAVSYPRADLEANGWKVGLTLGD